MDEARLYPKYRYVMGILLILCAGLTHLLCLVSAPMLVYFAEDFAVDAATAGYTSTLHILMQGVFIFIGPVVIGWIDIKKTQLLGIAVMVLGAVACYFAPSFNLLLAARVLTGIGHGLSSACTNSIVAAWFPAKEKSAIITANALGIVAVTTTAYTATVPLYHAFGNSWRAVFLFWGAVVAVLDVAWLIFARDNRALNDFIREKNAREGRKTNAFSGMREAISRRDVWLVCLFMGLATIAANGFSTYLPQFLQNVRGYSDAEASAVVGITTGVGAVGTFLGGVATTALGRRKIIILPFLTGSALFIALALLFEAPWLIALFFFLYSFCTNFRSAASQTISTELENITPALASSASAMSYGVGFIGTFACSPILRVATAAMGEERSMLVFVPFLLLSLLFVALLPETGPGRRES